MVTATPPTAPTNEEGKKQSSDELWRTKSVDGVSVHTTPTPRTTVFKTGEERTALNLQQARKMPTRRDVGEQESNGGVHGEERDNGFGFSLGERKMEEREKWLGFSF